MRNTKSYQTISLFVFAFLVPMGAVAGEVASDFNAGDTLTATQMTEIKNAVNDNYSRIDVLERSTDSDTLSTLSCDNGQVAKFNGTAWECAADIDTDTNSGGDITAVNAGNGLSGGGSSGDVTISLNGAVSFSTVDFKVFEAFSYDGTGQGGCDFSSNALSLQFTAASTNNNCDAIAPVHLPHDVEINLLECVVFDNDATTSSEIRARLTRRSMTAANTSFIYLLSTNSSITQPNGKQVIASSATSIFVDNTSYVYTLLIDFGTNTSLAGGDLQLYGCMIFYS